MKNLLLREGRSEFYKSSDLSNSEIFKLIFGEKTGQKLMDSLGQDPLMSLICVPIQDIRLCYGSQIANKINALRELLNRIEKPLRSRTHKINNPKDVMLIVNDMRSLEQEELRVISLNADNVVLNIEMVYKGTVSASICEPHSILRTALLSNAVGFILVHNHPSGQCEPSQDDISTTKRIAQAAKCVGLTLLDHIVIGQEDKESGYDGYSMKEAGII